MERSRGINCGKLSVVADTLHPDTTFADLEYEERAFILDLSREQDNGEAGGVFITAQRDGRIIDEVLRPIARQKSEST